MADKVCKLAKVVAIVGGAYIIGNYILFSFYKATDYWEVIGYINGMVIGAGSASAASDKLTEWGNAYRAALPELDFLTFHFLDHGTKRIAEVYGESVELIY